MGHCQIVLNTAWREPRSLDTRVWNLTGFNLIKTFPAWARIFYQRTCTGVLQMHLHRLINSNLNSFTTTPLHITGILRVITAVQEMLSLEMVNSSDGYPSNGAWGRSNKFIYAYNVSQRQAYIYIYTIIHI